MKSNTRSLSDKVLRAQLGIKYADAQQRLEQELASFASEHMDRDAAVELAAEVCRRRPQVSGGGKVMVTAYRDIEAKLTDWLWEDRLPRAALSLIVGTEGLGKTAIGLSLAAQASRGTLPGCLHSEPVNVALFTPEDDPSRTLRPRLEAAGADLARVFDMKMMRDRFDSGFSLPDDSAQIAEALIEGDIRLILSDPLASMLDPKRNSWKDTDVRGALEPLIAVCAEHDITWTGTLHTNKTSSTDPRQKGMGSVGWRQVARASFLMGLDPDDAMLAAGSARCLAHDKHNLGPWTRTLRVALDTVDVKIAGVTKPVVGAVLGEECDVTAAQMLAAEQGFESASDLKLDQAVTWLRRELESGPRAVEAIEEKRAAAGHSQRTIERAKQKLDVQSKQGPNGWTWELRKYGPLAF
jgi:hypothetical protein